MRCFLIVILSFLPFNGMANIPRFLKANKTPELKPYDYSAEYDGLNGPVKDVITFKGRINSVFGNKTLVKDHPLGHDKYLPNGLRMEAYMLLDDFSRLDYGVKYYYNNSKIDSICIYDHHGYEGYDEKPNDKITFEYVSPDSIIEKYYEFKEVCYGKKDWEQTKQFNIKVKPGGFESIFFPSIIDEGEISLYISQDLKFNFKDKRRDPMNNPILFQNSIFRLDRLSLIKEAVRFTKDGAGEIKTDDLGRLIRIRPSQKWLNQLLSDGNNSYKATHVEYDEKGNIAKIVYSEHFTSGRRQNRNWKHIEDDVIKVDYTYDSYGNWTMAKITTYNQSLDRNLPSYGKVSNKKESYYIREISYYSDNDKTLPTSFFIKEEKVDEKVDEKADDGIGQPIYDAVEQSPRYTGGGEQLTYDAINCLPEKYKYEEDGKYPAKIIVKLAVYKSGKIDNIEIIKGGENLSDNESDEITEAFKQLGAFYPGKNNGKAVNSWFTFSVQLYLTSSQLPEYAKRKAYQEEASRLCTVAYYAIEKCNLMQEYNNLSKSLNSTAVAAIPKLESLKSTDYTIPNNMKLEQIVKYEVNGSLYTFIKEDKTIIPNVHFNRIVHDLDYSYHNYGYLSDDKRFTLIIYRNNKTKDYIYLVEFEGNEVKSICNIPYKGSKGFVLPKL